MSENAVKKENWGSRIGYILSTLGMSIGVGAMWRFPMLTAKYGGGTFVLAFIIISIVAVIPAGWAESALGRKYKRSTAGNLEAVAGKKGKAFGTFMAAIPMCLAFYYPVVMAICAVYMGSTIGGAPFLNDVEGYYNQINANRPLIYAIVLAVIILTALISLGGIKKGVEKCCKILLPALFVVLLVVDIRVFTLDGIAEGLYAPQRPVLGVQWHPERQSFGLRRPDAVDAAPVFRWLRGALTNTDAPLYNRK